MQVRASLANALNQIFGCHLAIVTDHQRQTSLCPVCSACSQTGASKGCNPVMACKVSVCCPEACIGLGFMQEDSFHLVDSRPVQRGRGGRRFQQNRFQQRRNETGRREEHQDRQPRKQQQRRQFNNFRDNQRVWQSTHIMVPGSFHKTQAVAHCCGVGELARGQH